jgi:hypothetical protein
LYKPAVQVKKKLRYGLRQVSVLMVAIRQGTLFSGVTSSVFSKDWGNQKFMEYPVSIPRCDNKGDLIEHLKNCNLRFHEGGWTIYVPPQQGLEAYFPFLASHYPPNVGLKILKSFESPESAKYVTKKYIMHPPHPFWNGDIPQLIRVANYMYLHGIGPRVYDVISMKSQTQIFTSFVMQHIDSQGLLENDYDTFMTQLNDVLSKDDIMPAIQMWEAHPDFSKPDCHGNLIRDAETGRLYYVDCQSFMFKNEKRYLQNIVTHHKKTLHFGIQDAILGGKFLYQSISGLDHGRRDTERRWRIIKELLDNAGVDMQNAVVFDVCCNAGMMLYHSLVEGAYWGVGWDLPAVAQVANALQSALGITRIEIFGQEISENSDFLKDLPSQVASKGNGILFYLAARKHIGFPKGVGELPWTTMIYEGHGKEDFEKTRGFFEEVSWLQDTTIEAMTTNKAELGEIRTMALIKRKLKH